MPSSSQRFQVISEDVPWSCPDGKTLLARVYRPAAIKGAPVLVNIHGGAWSSGDRTQADVYHRGLAEAGCVVASIDFRDGACLATLRAPLTRSTGCAGRACTPKAEEGRRNRWG